MRRKGERKELPTQHKTRATRARALHARAPTHTLSDHTHCICSHSRTDSEHAWTLARRQTAAAGHISRRATTNFASALSDARIKRGLSLSRARACLRNPSEGEKRSLILIQWRAYTSPRGIRTRIGSRTIDRTVSSFCRASPPRPRGNGAVVPGT